MGETRSRVDPAEIREQRERGWPDIHPEDYCHTCGRRNPVWSSPEWVELVGSHAGILCPLCFMELDPDRMWKVTRQGWPGDDQVRQLAGVLRGVADCDEPERVARCVLDAGWVRANEETDTDDERTAAMTELSPEQVTNIRAVVNSTRGIRPSSMDVVYGDLLALCDTVDHLRARLDETGEYDEQAAALFDANQEMGAALAEARTEVEAVTAERDELANVIAYEGVRELETLRGIVARICDDWKPYEQANGSTPRWVRSGDAGQIEDDLLTPAEVEAIYRQEEKDTNG